MKDDRSDYNYTSAGFDAFLSRSIDNVSQINLDSGGYQSQQVRYDHSQISGMLGDKLTVGNIILDGTIGRISIVDNALEVVRIGKLDD